MRVCPALSFAALIVAVPFAAGAQFGGMPGSPGGPLTPPRPPLPSACQQLQTLRAEIQKHSAAIQEANKRKASAQEACQLFKSFLSAEAEFVNSLEENSQACGVPTDAIKQVKEGHAKAGQFGKQVCEAAARSPRGYYKDCNVCGKMGDWGPLLR
jgi:hypothetical protein